MEVQFEPEVQAKLEEMARESGRPAVEFVKDAVADYFDGLARTRETLNSRYDDIKSGRVKLIPGEEVEEFFREKFASTKSANAGS